MIALTLCLLAVTGCGGGGGERVSGPPPAAPAAITLGSADFADGGTIPRRFTCSGAGDTPELHWSGVPSGARELALLVEDPDAPGGTFVHWTLYGLDAGLRALPAAAVPTNATEGANSRGEHGWTPPCPPEGDSPHRYVFTLYALRAPSGLEAHAAPEDVRSAVAAGATARGQLVGRFGR